MIDLSEYWDNRYKNNSDSWSLNSPNPVFVQLLAGKKFPLKKELLVLGCGKGHDAFAAAELGFNVNAVDFSKTVISDAENLFPQQSNRPKFFRTDIFELEDSGKIYDVIYEYTVFCSIRPERIEDMLDIISSSLENGGYFITILFPLKELNYAPPNAIDLFSFIESSKKYFSLVYFQKNIDSIKPRKGNEVLLIFKKTDNKMARNLELKTRLNNFEEINEILKAKDITRKDLLMQKDTYYYWEKGLLKLRSVNGSFEFIKYNRDESGENRWSDYFVLEISDDEVEKFFENILNVETVVKKKRELFIYEHTRIHLDDVEVLGKFLELETVVAGDLEDAKKEFEEVVSFLKLDTSNQIKTSYRNLMLEK